MTSERDHGCDEADDDAIVLRALLAEDLDTGFVALVRSYETLVYSLAVRICASPADAEDLSAETFSRAYRALRGFPAERIAALRPRAWLATIALNAGRNRRRDGARRPHTVPLVEGAEPAGRAGSADDWVDRDDDDRRLGELLDGLPEIQRTAVVLRHIGELSIAEVADVLRCPEGTAKSHISRGLRSLRSAHPTRHRGDEEGDDHGD